MTTRVASDVATDESSRPEKVGELAVAATAQRGLLSLTPSS
jgi:hypothetical protein